MEGQPLRELSIPGVLLGGVNIIALKAPACVLSKDSLCLWRVQVGGWRRGSGDRMGT